jgi:hypothetical protein
MGPGTGAAFSVMSLASLLLFQSPSDVGQWKDLGLTGALIIAVGFLWRALADAQKLATSERAIFLQKLEDKDVLIVELVKSTTAVLTATGATVNQLRETVEDSTEAKLGLTQAITNLQVHCGAVWEASKPAKREG